MNPRLLPSAPKSLVLALVAAIFATVAYFTLNPWPVAVEKLSAVGPGPYVPFSYSYRSSTSNSGTKTYRSQSYWVVSQVGTSWSTYRVIEENETARVEEVKFGMLYGTAFLTVFIVGGLLGLSRATRA
jgi:hypothetical protein